MDWTARLAERREIFSECPDGVLPKPTKGGSVSFGGTPDGRLQNIAAIRDNLLTIALGLGLPDALVLELPASELQATAEQHADFAAEKGEELGHRLLTFYLKSLAGLEPALPGSLAARDAPALRARWQA